MTAAAATHHSESARTIFLLGAVIALSHLADTWLDTPLPWGPAWKCAGIAILGLYALRMGAIAVGLALLLSSVGDVLLELGSDVFIYGMAAFGLAHVCYIVAFIDIIRRDGLQKAGIPIAAVVVVVSAALAMWLAPGMATMGLTVPASAYQVIISIMVVTAMLSKTPVLAKVGAVVFMLSDTLIAMGMFAGIQVVPGSVWITYAAAQIMLAWSLTRRAT